MEPYNVYQSGSDMDEVYMKSKGLYGLTGRIFVAGPQRGKTAGVHYYEYGDTPEFLTMMSRWNERLLFQICSSDTDSRNSEAVRRPPASQTWMLIQTNTSDHPEWGVKYANLVSDVSNLPFTQDAMAIASTSKTRKGP